MCSFNQLILRNACTISCPGKQQESLMGFKIKTDKLWVRHTNHFAPLFGELFEEIIGQNSVLINKLNFVKLHVSSFSIIKPKCIENLPSI